MSSCWPWSTTSSSAWPTISSISFGRSSSDSGPSPTVWPSRRTVAQSPIWKISLSRCETKITATPSSRSRRTTRNSDSTSSSVSELVGSSRISTRASIERARAISTICCWSGRRRRTGSDGSRSRPSRASASRARRRVPRQSMKPRRATIRCPRKTFSAIERSGASVVSWVTVAMPCRSASIALRHCIGLPPSMTSPLSRCTWPERIFSSVDLPEPFSPTSTCTSPGRTCRCGTAEGMDAAVALVDAVGAEDLGC